MLFSYFRGWIDVGEDSTLAELAGHGSAVVTQVKDQKAFANKYIILPTASQVQIDFSTSLTLGYRWGLFSDYPIMYRTNGASATQKTLTSGGVAAVNIGAPSPFQCFVIATEQISSLYVQPISGAGQTANVKVIIIGDPTSAYV